LPDGWHTLTPRIFVREPHKLVLFLQEVFAATGAPADMPYGDRRAMVRDEWGNTWQIATRGGGAPS